MKAILLALTIFIVGATTSISNAQDNTVSYDALRRALNSTCRLRMYEDGKLVWMGSAVVFEKTEAQIKMISNSHVLGPLGGEGVVTAEFCVDGDSLGEHTVTILHSFKDNSNTLDFGLCVVPNKVMLNSVPAVTFSKQVLKKGDKIFQCGCDGGNWCNGSLGKVSSIYEGYFEYTPPALPGDSGSAVFSHDGRHIVGLTAWRFYDPELGAYVGRAMTVDAIMDEMSKSGSQKPKLYPAPNPPRRIFPRFRRATDGPDADVLDWSPIRDFINQKIDAHSAAQAAQIEDLEQQQVGLLDRMRQNRLERQNNFRMLMEERRLERLESQSRLDKITSKFEGLMGKVRLMIWTLTAIAIIVGLTLFFGPGWLALMVFRIVTTLVRLVMAVFHVIKNAVTTPPITRPDHEFDSFQERFDELQTQIGDAVNEED